MSKLINNNRLIPRTMRFVVISYYNFIYDNRLTQCYFIYLMILHTSFIFYIYYYIYNNIAKSLGKTLNLFLLYTSYQIIYLRTLCYIILINIFNIFILFNAMHSICGTNYYISHIH